MKQLGFTLVETIMYTCLLCMVAIVAFSWLAQVLKSSHQLHIQSKQVMMAQTIMQRLASDVRMADSGISRWQIENGSVRIPIQSHTVCWRQERDKLYRIENNAKALLATGMAQFAPKLITKDLQVDRLDCQISFSDVRITHSLKVSHG